MTGADNSDSIYKPSKIFRKWAKEEKIRKKMKEGIHCHLAWFGSELNCPKCNPICWQNHAMDNPNHLKPCKNPKCPLKRKIKPKTPAICISPFFTGKDAEAFIKQDKKPLTSKEKKHLKKCQEIYEKNPIKELLIKKQKELGFQHYPHIPILISNARLKRSLLGLRLQWTLKDDGENVTIWLRKKKYSKKSCSLYIGLINLPKGFELIISSHNQEIAASDITARVMATEDYSKILKLIGDNPSFRVVAEECAKGPSVTGIRQYPRNILIVVDIFDASINNFLPYTQVYQYCYHYGIPVVVLYATTRHRTIRDLNKFISHVLQYCNLEKEWGKDEGMVVKTFRERHRCKDCDKEW